MCSFSIWIFLNFVPFKENNLYRSVQNSKFVNVYFQLLQHHSLKICYFENYHTHARARTLLHAHARAPPSPLPHTHTHAHTFTHAYTRARARTTHTPSHTHTSTQTQHTNHTHARAHTHTYTHNPPHAHTHTRAHARAHTHTHARTHTQTHTSTCVQCILYMGARLMNWQVNNLPLAEYEYPEGNFIHYRQSYCFGKAIDEIIISNYNMENEYADKRICWCYWRKCKYENLLWCYHTNKRDNRMDDDKTLFESPDPISDANAPSRSPSLLLMVCSYSHRYHRHQREIT